MENKSKLVQALFLLELLKWRLLKWKIRIKKIVGYVKIKMECFTVSSDNVIKFNYSGG